MRKARRVLGRRPSWRLKQPRWRESSQEQVVLQPIHPMQQVILRHRLLERESAGVRLFQTRLQVVCTPVSLHRPPMALSHGACRLYFLPSHLSMDPVHPNGALLLAGLRKVHRGSVPRHRPLNSHRRHPRKCHIGALHLEFRKILHLPQQVQPSIQQLGLPSRQMISPRRSSERTTK
jgi:hypothetical protein